GGSLHRTSYHVFGNGEVVMTNAFVPGGIDLPDMPKFGMTLTLPRALDHVEWLGRGPHESYADRKRGAAVGQFGSLVDDLFHPYIRPQETGQRTDVRWVSLATDRGVGLLAVADPLMEFSALRYEDEDLDEGDAVRYRHVYDLAPRDYVVLDLDHVQMGVGGDTSWGAAVHPEYRVPAVRMTYRIRLVPFGPGDAPARVLGRERF
ncbi:MAG: beta-galactosidase small subunit, partial [Acidobacteriota bacterium]|nr:beta-galactosidase small subunit [Acidobacteriota bacterium]